MKPRSQLLVSSRQARNRPNVRLARASSVTRAVPDRMAETTNRWGHQGRVPPRPGDLQAEDPRRYRVQQHRSRQPYIGQGPAVRRSLVGSASCWCRTARSTTEKTK